MIDAIKRLRNRDGSPTKASGVKTNRRDAVTLARLLRAGDLTAVWVPDPVPEAVRDLVRARAAAAEDLRRKRQQLLSFLLRHGRIYNGREHWTRGHLRWLAQPKFDHPAQQIVFPGRGGHDRRCRDPFAPPR